MFFNVSVAGTSSIKPDAPIFCSACSIKDVKESIINYLVSVFSFAMIYIIRTNVIDIFGIYLKKKKNN